MSQSTPRLAVVNGLRALAIVGVLWHHTVYKLWLAPKTLPNGEFLHDAVVAVLNSGWLGVNLFFVLSGFVLYLPYARGDRRADTPSAWLEFLKRRARRLLPLLYTSLLIFACMDALSGRTSWTEDLARYVTVTYIFFEDTFFPSPNWVLWSLGVEVWFSLLFPLLVLAIRRYGMSRVLVLTLIFSYVVRTVGVQPEFFGPGDRLNPLKDGILGRLDDFFFGMWACDAYVRGRFTAAQSRAAICVALVAGIASGIMWERVVHDAVFSQVVPLLHNGVQIASASLLVAALSTRDRWVALFSNSAVQLVGMMCFSIYVWHGRLIEMLLTSTFAIHEFAAYVLAVGSIAVVSYKYIEFPHISWPAVVRVNPR